MYADITQQIIKKIEDGCPPWLRPYNKFGGGLPLRHNGIPYRGMNIIMLWMCDFDNPYWMTYPQAQQLGGQVRKGEKSPTKVFHFGTAKDKDKEDRFYSYAKAYSVFNASQITGLPSHYYPKQELYINADKPVASIDKQLATIYQQKLLRLMDAHLATVQQQMKSTCHRGLTLLMALHITAQRYMSLSIGQVTNPDLIALV